MKLFNSLFASLHLKKVVLSNKPKSLLVTKGNLLQNTCIMIERKIATEVKALNAPSPQFLDILPPLIHLVITKIFQLIVGRYKLQKNFNTKCLTWLTAPTM